ncbi:hypothetical protein ES702_00357 [subsurface metagenome]
MPTVLFFRPDTDTALQHGAFWLGLGIPEATRRGFDVIDMVDEACTFDTLEEIMASKKIDVVILLGHGNYSTFTGFAQKKVFEACHNDELMSGTISHFLSCSVGQVLLPSIIGKKGIWTIGYNVDFQFLINPEFAVENDPVAEPFRDVTVAIIKAILDGKKLKGVWDAGIAECDRWIAKLYNRPEIIWAEVAGALRHDRDGMIALGDQEAYVLPPRRVVLNVPQLAGLAFLVYLLVTKGKTF